jgi:thiamine pyrophosphate-dependent acetolactate synthase large subunit-like protein
VKTVEVDTAAEALLVLMRERGIEYLFGNAGTDAAPLIEAFARLHACGLPAPRPVTVAHEMCVRSSVADVAPDGWAVRSGNYALTALQPSPEFHRVAEACGGYGERVEDPAEVPDAIQRGLKHVRDGRHAVLNVICGLSS